MIVSAVCRILQTDEQEILFRKSSGTAFWAYNYFLAENERIYNEYLTNGKEGIKSISENEVRKYINNVLKKTTHKWLSEVSSNVMKQAVKDADKARKDWLKGLKGKPKFKSKHKDKPSFYVNYESLKRLNGGFHGEKLGFVRTSEPLPKIPKNQHYLNPRISFDGKYWYLSVSYEIPEQPYEIKSESLGIDLGIKDLAVCSNGNVYKNINKTKKIRNLKRKLKRAQRKLSRKLEHNIKDFKIVNGYKCPIYDRSLYECKNIQNQKKQIKLIHRKLNNIRKNYLHQTTTELVKTKPSRIVMETLNIKGMMKNKHLSKAVEEECFYEFKRQIKYKCQKYSIPVIEVPQFYPSSKTCSCCGSIKKDLKLSDRIYICNNCGLIIDRDYNASLNLANYKPT